jgi:hypothetical protein
MKKHPLALCRILALCTLFTFSTLAFGQDPPPENNNSLTPLVQPQEKKLSFDLIESPIRDTLIQLCNSVNKKCTFDPILPFDLGHITHRKTDSSFEDAVKSVLFRSNYALKYTIDTDGNYYIEPTDKEKIKKEIAADILDKPITIGFSNVPMTKALEMLFKKHNIPYKIENAGTYYTSWMLPNLPFKTVLNGILKQSPRSLVWEYKNNILYVRDKDKLPATSGKSEWGTKAKFTILVEAKWEKAKPEILLTSQIPSIQLSSEGFGGGSPYKAISDEKTTGSNPTSFRVEATTGFAYKIDAENPAGGMGGSNLVVSGVNIAYQCTFSMPLKTGKGVTRLEKQFSGNVLVAKPGVPTVIGKTLLKQYGQEGEIHFILILKKEE